MSRQEPRRLQPRKFSKLVWHLISSCPLAFIIFASFSICVIEKGDYVAPSKIKVAGIKNKQKVKGSGMFHEFREQPWLLKFKI